MGLSSYFHPSEAPQAVSTKQKQPGHEMSHLPASSGSIRSATGGPFSTPIDVSSASSPASSRPSSLSPGFNGSSSSPEIVDIKCDVMVNYLYQQQQERLWTSVNGDDEGVVLKKSRGCYTSCPADLSDNPHGLIEAIEMLNVRVAITVNTKVIKLFLHNSKSTSIPLSNGLRVQVLPDISHLPRCQKHQFAAFIADRGQLIVWDDDPRHVLKRASKIEAELLEMVWEDESIYHADSTGKGGVSVAATEVSADGASDLEANVPAARTLVLWQPISVALSLMLLLAATGSGAMQIAIEIYIDHNWMRLAFVLVWPLQVWLSLFFFQALSCNILQLIGPVNQMKINSKFYSGLAPKRLARGVLPHVTIQMPVYKEGLETVIEPTIKSIKAAISTYEMQGGTANIFVNDDGMQLISNDLAQARRDCYEEHNIGWVARPKHNPKPAEGEDLFLRRGKFKKASNMNYAMWVSVRIEEKLLAASRASEWTAEDEATIYAEALNEIITEDEGRTWAEGNVRIGDYILIIDSDTRVPADCFLDAVSEMHQSPEVAILQFASGVMNVTNSFFERAITFFTNLVYTQIRYAVANGDSAPFVGHNAVLRWSAIQSIAYDCPDDNREKFWSEATVSEDFDMALRLQSAGYLVRLGAYTGDGFQEGVSLTVYDELARWEKYAYGCSELIFHPLCDWFKRGPFTPLFRRFIASSMPLPSKITIMAYVGTYYAIGSAWLLTLLNYFLVGWYNGWLDHYYNDSFKIFFAIIVVFTALGNLALAVLRYRIGERALVPALLEVYKWVPLLTVFLGGISLHVSQAILSHMFGIDMSWGATAKEVENTTFFEEIPKVLKLFKFTFAFCIILIGTMIGLAFFAPTFWEIRIFIAIWPLSTVVFGHLFLPIALNPRLMMFTW